MRRALTAWWHHRQRRGAAVAVLLVLLILRLLRRRRALRATAALAIAGLALDLKLATRMPGTTAAAAAALPSRSGSAAAFPRAESNASLERLL